MNDQEQLSFTEALARADPYQNKGTTYLHGNEKNNLKDPGNPTGAVVYPISIATTFQQSHPGEPSARDDPRSFGLGYEYSRTGNPTRGAFELAMASAEKAKYCVAFASGSAATSAVVHLLNHGQKIISVDDVYGGTQRYFRKIVAPSMGIDTEFVNFDDISNLSSVISNEKVRLIWLESPTNPTLKLSDIQAIAKISKENNCILAVDNTFCSPYFQNPLILGADLCVHSVTKYIGGHSDTVMGVVCCNDETLYRQLRFIQNGIGAVPSPFDCFLAHRGLKTLHIRMEAAARNAMAIALFLEMHDAVTKVLYPGLHSHPQHELAKRQQDGFGAMITFYCIGGCEQSGILLRSVSASIF